LGAPGTSKHRFGLRSPLLVAIAYCVFSALWIFLTDELLDFFHLSPEAITRWGMAKGLLYVGVSGALIYIVVRRFYDLNQNLETMVANRTAALAQEHEALQKQAETLKTLIECTPVGLAFLDRDMRYLEVSSRWCQDYGLDRAAILGKSHYEVFPDLPQRWREVHQRAMAGEVIRSDGDSFTDSNGKEHWLRWEVRPWGDPGAVTGGMIIFAEDITEQHQLERQLLQAQKMEAVGQLAGGVAHDFNNLLMVIRASTELLKESVLEPQKVIANADRVLDASSRAASVTRQLLAFSRKQPQNLTFVDPNSVITDLGKMLPTLVGEDIELSLKPRARGTLHVDRSQLEQVIMNLVVNARDAMPHGGKLVIETTNALVDGEVSLRHGAQVPPGNYVLVSVTDTGTGMDENTQEHIFEPFFTTKGLGKGTGLGLSTVYGIVKQSGGFIWVYSEVGYGTTFRVYLPQLQGSVVETPVPKRKSTRVNGTATVLLVEDEPALREVMHDYLQARGFKILTAEDGEAALRLAESRKEIIHVVLTDVVMPGMRGTELAAKISRIHPEARLIFMSGYSGHILEEEMLPGATFVQKPIDLASLADRIQEAAVSRATSSAENYHHGRQ